MSDEFDIIHLDQEDSQDIIDWAVGAAAMVTLMSNIPPLSGEETIEDRLEGYVEAFQLMNINMPDILIAPAAAMAADAIDSSIAEEKQVEQFRAELEEL